MTPQEFAGKMDAAADALLDTQPLMQSVGKLAKDAAYKQITSGPNRAYRTGALAANINERVESTAVTMTNDLDYDPYVRQGTSKMWARDYMGAGVEDAAPAIEGELLKFGEAALAKVGG